MNIQITHMSIVNFKGIRSFEADFDQVTEFRGDNATGKTTLFDAFTWCLYGKDSSGRSDSNFRLKTLDENNKVIEKIPHEVEIVLSVDGQENRLRKTYTEDWRKKRGSKTEQLVGHVIERYWNDVPMIEKDYIAKINTICSEDVFKLITNPTFFLSMPKKDQRQFLIDMAGEVSREDLANEHPEFGDLVKEMTGKSYDEFAKEIGAKIKRLKAEIEGIPQRIDERERDMAQEDDWSAIEQEISAKQAEMDALEQQITSANAAYEQQNKHRQSLFQQMSDINLAISKRATELRQVALSEYYQRKSEQDALANESRQLNAEVERMTRSMADLNKAIAACTAMRERLIAEWHTIKSRTWQGVDESQFICPTCHRPLEQSDIDEKIAEMERNYNAETARLLANNKQQGISNNETKASYQQQAEQLETKIAQYKQRIQEIASRIEPIAMPDVDISFDGEIQSLLAKKAQIQSLIDQDEVKSPDLTDVKSQRTMLSEAIQSLHVRLSVRDHIQANRERINELKEQLRKQNDEIARLEGIQYQISEFKHLLIDQVEERINSMFSVVKFKMYEQQINGGEVETCEALVHGVPYSTNLNTAARINAGIDIINAISNHNDVYAPIWVDNRESITNLLPTNSQVINLIKDDNYQLLTRI